MLGHILGILLCVGLVAYLCNFLLKDIVTVFRRHNR